jgi:hypothetical protein
MKVLQAGFDPALFPVLCPELRAAAYENGGL